MASLTWVFIHGWGSDSRSWQDLLEFLPLPVECWGLPGFEPSPGVDGGESLERVLAHFECRLPERCVLVGWSLGGMIATRLAVSNPERVMGLVTIATNPQFIGSLDWPSAMAPETFAGFCQQFKSNPDRTLKRFYALQGQGDSRRQQVVPRLQAVRPCHTQASHNWQESLNWLKEINNRKSMEQLHCPQLHIFGDGDSLVPIELAHQLKRRGIPARIVEHAGHAPHISQPALVSRYVLDWIKQERISSCGVNPIQKSRIAESFSSAATTYDQNAHVQRKIADDLISILPANLRQGITVDLGCGTGFITERLRGRCENVIGVDIAAGMLGYFTERYPGTAASVADAEQLPFADNSLQNIVSNLALQWCPTLTPAASEANRALTEGGYFVFSTLCSDTLWELKKAWSQVDNYVHVNHFQKRNELENQVRGAGLEICSVRHYPVVVHYPQVVSLLRELKAIGAHNMNSGCNRGLTSSTGLRTLEKAYRQFANSEGMLPATYDVLLVVARKGAQKRVVNL